MYDKNYYKKLLKKDGVQYGNPPTMQNYKQKNCCHVIVHLIYLFTQSLKNTLDVIKGIIQNL